VLYWNNIQWWSANRGKLYQDHSFILETYTYVAPFQDTTDQALPAQLSQRIRTSGRRKNWKGGA